MGFPDDFEFNKYLDDNGLKESEFSYRSFYLLLKTCNSLKAYCTFFP